MFTGIVDHCGSVSAIQQLEKNLQFTINCQFTDLKLGESIAVDGICLTVTQLLPAGFSCDISPETYRLTTAHFLKIGSEVNLERSLRLTDRLGGHFVSGHVDCCMKILERTETDEFVRMVIGNFRPEQMTYLLRKGSIAINGVSLTLNEIHNTSIEIMLIPHTLAITNLKNLSVGSYVNIEFDWLAKLFINYIEKQTPDKIKLT